MMKILMVSILYFSSIVKMRKSHRHDESIQDRMGPDDSFKDRMIPLVNLVFNMYYLIRQLVFRITHLVYCGTKLCSNKILKLNNHST